ncbi:hypothetical protein RO3G_11700 [Rhizopus delemar RA 99-880]|uniref:Uncharacterized protein n=1 Tax=Rhizopus delemar (strain RA 99-880 / ATCC MYA-4621 / FGSC 9543 / NRRL 43880) TaxID=246409 RepID=I1CEV9_RHIO9|nr:hypothetical protein RO3G_11700 [Rhizopus delemar RA 99-880]|eukprot:EIE86989.1 hypothetical protein RO3G_11700 [Rhizopus delemar RA 99-880]
MRRACPIISFISNIIINVWTHKTMQEFSNLVKTFVLTFVRMDGNTWGTS